MEEIWKPIDGYEGFYEVSNKCIVKSLDRVVIGPYGANHKLKGIILKQAPHKDGYLRILLNKNGKAKLILLHRLILEAFVGPCPEGMRCRHLDGNPLNNNLENLKWGTLSQNQLDRVDHGTDSRGEKHWRHKLTEKEVIEIRDSNETRKELAKKYNVSQGTISYIINRKIWKHI